MPKHQIANHLAETLADLNAKVPQQEIDSLPPCDFDAEAQDWDALLAPASASMKSNGCAILRQFVSKGTAVQFRNAVESLLASEPIAGHITARTDLETDGFLLNCTFENVPGGKHTTVTDLVKLGKPVINVRKGDIGPAGDDGMVDIFHVDRLFPEHEHIFSEKRRTAFIESVLREASGKPYRSCLFNLYINRSIMETRGYHSDGFGPKVKSFLYLNDISDETMGPYCYGRGTYNHLSLRTCNQELSTRFEETLKSTTFDFWDRRREIKFLGQAGRFRHDIPIRRPSRLAAGSGKREIRPCADIYAGGYRSLVPLARETLS